MYFKYKLRGFSSIPDEEGLLYVPDIDGEIYRDAGQNGEVVLPATQQLVPVVGLFIREVFLRHLAIIGK